MVKKDFTVERPKRYDNMSDIDLIEQLNQGTLNSTEINVINAILNKRSKRIVQYLTEVTKKSNKIQGIQNWFMIALTIAILILTGVLVWNAV